MAEEVHAAAKDVEMWSNLRDAYLHSANTAMVADELGLSSVREMEEVQKTGCRIRFVFRKENF